MGGSAQTSKKFCEAVLYLADVAECEGGGQKGDDFFVEGIVVLIDELERIGGYEGFFVVLCVKFFEIGFESFSIFHDIFTFFGFILVQGALNIKSDLIGRNREFELIYILFMLNLL